MKKHIDELTKKYFVLHVCGRGAFNNDKTNVTNTNDNLAINCKNTSTNDNAPNDNSDSGTFKSKRTEGAYLCFEYADNIADFYAASDVVVSRAGATAVYEISALKKRAVFVPLPKGVSRGDQIFNAQLAEEYGAFTLCQNEQFSDNFLSTIEKALQNPPMRALSSDANGKIADIVCDSIGRGEKCRNKKLSPNGSQLSYS